MAKKSAMRQVLGFVRDVDDTVKIATGKRIHQHVSRIMDVYGPDVKQAAVDAFLKSDPPEPL
ncbi:MAG: hypothetical protein Q8R28_09805, partial [Dehalococcoidia bacterium]|nr:hypothetical protein [Dehalococcoidia bacterium]